MGHLGLTPQSINQLGGFKVKGKDASPLYLQLRKATGDTPGWNFHKFLIGRDGEVAASFGSRTKPDDPALLAKIESLLAASPVEPEQPASNH